MEDHPIVVLSTMVNKGREVTSKYRIMDPYDQEWIMHQNTVLGSTKRIQNELVVFLPSADENDKNGVFQK